MATKVIGEAARFVRDKRVRLQRLEHQVGLTQYESLEVEGLRRYLSEVEDAAAWIVGVNHSVLHRIGGCSLRRYSNHICAPISETRAAAYLAAGARWCGRCA